MKRDILIIDDKEKLCTSLQKSLRGRGYTALYALNWTEAKKILFSHEIRLILLDVKLGEENGLSLLREIRKLKPEVKIIMITGFATVDMAVDSLKEGAIDFIQKPIAMGKLIGVVEKALDTRFVQKKESSNDGKKRSGCANPTIVTNSNAMIELLQKACSIADSDLSVLILGESGTGKELIADYIHYHSPRKANECVKINCSAFPETLLDNELFGHDKGAFTGAASVYKGVFERADNGSLFLDELGDMPMFLQPKVLRAIQNKEVRRLGGKETIHIDVRFIASTNKNLQEYIKREKFREDLFYRLGAARLHVPPLREKKEDIPLLIDFFLEKMNEKREEPKVIEDVVIEILTKYNWPGNIRELENAIRYSAVVSKQKQIKVEDLPPYLTPSGGITANTANNLEEHERKIIEETLKQVNFNKKRAAEILNISRVTLYRKIEKYNIYVEENV